MQFPPRYDWCGELYFRLNWNDKGSRNTLCLNLLCTLSLSLFLSYSLTLSISVPVFVSRSIYLCLCICLSFYLSLSLYLSLFLSISVFFFCSSKKTYNKTLVMHFPSRILFHFYCEKTWDLSSIKFIVRPKLTNARPANPRLFNFLQIFLHRKSSQQKCYETSDNCLN